MNQRNGRRFQTALKLEKKGFTLIELLIVVAIIGLLSTLSILAINSARARARDTKRIADVYQISQALMMYYDANGRLPANNAATCLGLDDSDTCWGASNIHGNAAFNDALKPYMNKIPQDPSKGQRTLGNAYIYIPSSGNVVYHCGGSRVNGPLILWYPDNKTGPGFPDKDCLGKGFNACCGSVSCVYGYYCAYEIPL